jgi:outer membrane beta-barrel protein
VHVGFYINRFHSLHVSAGYAVYSANTSFVNNELVAKNSLSASQIGVEVPKLMSSIQYQYSPYYTKMHLTDLTTAHFDVYVGGGLGVLQNETYFASGTRAGSVTRPALALSAGLRFHMFSEMLMTLALEDFIHKAENFSAPFTANTLQMGLSLGMML